MRLFGVGKKNGETSIGRAKLPDDAPAMASAKEVEAIRAWFERYGHHYVEKNRYFTLLCLISLVAVSESLVLAAMFPLEKIEPYVITVAKDTGRPDAKALSAEPYQVDVADEKYFLGRFVSLAMEIDPATTEGNLKEAAGMCLDKGGVELQELVHDQQPLVKLANEPTFTRHIDINTITILPQGDTALVRIYTHELSTGDTTPITKSWMFTVHFKIVPPESDAAIYKNPLGLYVTDFAYQQEAVQADDEGAPQ